jgi:hypothetical protein
MPWGLGLSSVLGTIRNRADCLCRRAGFLLGDSTGLGKGALASPSRAHACLVARSLLVCGYAIFGGICRCCCCTLTAGRQIAAVLWESMLQQQSDGAEPRCCFRHSRFTRAITLSIRSRLRACLCVCLRVRTCVRVRACVRVRPLARPCVCSGACTRACCRLQRGVAKRQPRS